MGEGIFWENCVKIPSPTATPTLRRFRQQLSSSVFSSCPQFVLLLALFVRPLRSKQSGSAKSEAAYRKVVVRNVVCTVVMLVAYAVGTLGVGLSLVHISPTNQVQITNRSLEYFAFCFPFHLPLETRNIM